MYVSPEAATVRRAANRTALTQPERGGRERVWRALGHRTGGQSRNTRPRQQALAAARQRLQVLNEVALFVVGQPEAEDLLVVIDHVEQGREAAVVVEGGLLHRLHAGCYERGVVVRP